MSWMRKLFRRSRGEPQESGASTPDGAPVSPVEGADPVEADASRATPEEAAVVDAPVPADAAAEVASGAAGATATVEEVVDTPAAVREGAPTDAPAAPQEPRPLPGAPEQDSPADLVASGPRGDAVPAAEPVASESAASSGAVAATFVSHDVPDTAAAHAVLPVHLELRNAGVAPWPGASAGGPAVEVVVYHDDIAVSRHPLPPGPVPPGGRVHVHGTLRFTRPGRVRVGFALVTDGGRGPAPNGAEPLEVEVQVTEPLGSVTDRDWDRAVRHDPWSYQPTQGLARGRDGHRYPLFTHRARGCRLWDTAGREYLDYVMGWGAVLLGYGHPEVDRALHAAIDLTAPVVPYAHPFELDVAERLCEDIPSAEMATFGKNGSDVCTLAVRVARALTGRKTVLFCGYHGWHDWWVEHLGFEGTGVPARGRALVHRFRFNDAEDFRRLFHAHEHDLAAVVLEPASPWGGQDVGWEGDADPSFLRLVSEWTRRAGALLVYDEIATGFRYREGSVQKATRVVPDMTCLGHALGSGMPLAALVGRADVLRHGVPASWYGPTHRWEVYSFAAARAALDVYRREPVWEHVWDHGRKLQEGLEDLLARSGAKARVTGLPCRLHTLFVHEDPARRAASRTLFVQELLRRGLSTANGVLTPSFAHDDESLATALEALGAALHEVAEAERRDDHDRRLEIPPLVDL